MIPQIIYLSLWFIGMLYEAYKHNKPHDGNHNVFIKLVASAIIFTLLYYGGFFDVFFK